MRTGSVLLRPPALRGIGIVAVTALALAGGAGPAGAKDARETICVGAERGCFATIQAAIDAARDGDTIRVNAGTFAGGVTITKSITVVGAGAGATAIRGGGPVVTAGAFGAATEPTVALSGVTITDGATTGGPVPDLERVIASGGGLYIPPGANSGPGATVSIADSVIRDNRVAPPDSAPVGPPGCPGGHPCEFAIAEGGGIANFGSLTLSRTTVTGNSVGAASGLPDASSDAVGGGIVNHGPSLTLVDSAVSGNRTAAAPPNARFAEGGGIFTNGPTTTIRGGELSGNVADLSSALPSTVEQNGVGAAIQVDNENATTTIDHVTVAGNRLVVTNSVGDATAFAAGPHVFGTLVMRDSDVTDNRIVATVPTGAPGDVLATSGGIEIDDNGTVTGSRFEGNAIEATGPNAVEAGGAGIDAEPLDGEAITVGDTLVRGNVLVARAGGTVTAHGAGIRNGGPLILGDVTVERNALVALGADGSAQGGGVWNGALDFDGAPPAPALTLRRTTIRRNTIRASAGVTVQGAGLFTDSPVTKADARIRDNVPDDCFGCP